MLFVLVAVPQPFLCGYRPQWCRWLCPSRAIAVSEFGGACSRAPTAPLRFLNCGGFSSRAPPAPLQARNPQVSHGSICICYAVPNN